MKMVEFGQDGVGVDDGEAVVLVLAPSDHFCLSQRLNSVSSGLIVAVSALEKPIHPSLSFVITTYTITKLGG